MKDFKMLYAFVCEDVRQEMNNKMIYIGQTEVFAVPQFPVVLHKLCIVYSCMGTKGKYKVSAVCKEAGTENVLIRIPEHEIEINGGEHKIREVIQINNLHVKKPGRYSVEIFYDGEKMIDFYVDISLPVTPQEKGEKPVNFPIILSSQN